MLVENALLLKPILYLGTPNTRDSIKAIRLYRCVENRSLVDRVAGASEH